MIVESRFGSGSPSGNCVAHAAAYDRNEEQGEEDRVPEHAASPAFRVEDLEERPEEVAGPVRMIRVDLPEHRRELGQERVEKPHFPHQEERRQRVAAAEGLRELLGHPGRRGFDDLLAVPEDRLVRVRRDREAEAARELDRAHHPDGVLPEADVGVADRAHEPGLEIVEARRRSR